MTGFVSAIQDRARQAARATAFSVMGVVFGLVGLGFLTVALWIVVANHESALVAYSVIGGLYVVLGFILLALGAQTGGSPDTGHRSGHRHDTRDHAPEAPAKEPLVQIAEGFAVGMQAGRAMREERD
ncbi:phage holin family protein [Rhodobacteraceae bacterium 63075]|nr:phage holin family protein [Rhodobacteraceae bacterium 63075]